jgi:protein phosphatase 1L
VGGRCAGAATQGTGRVNMEDTYTIEVDATGKEPAFFGVYDGHGGSAVSE